MDLFSVGYEGPTYLLEDLTATVGSGYQLCHTVGHIHDSVSTSSTPTAFSADMWFGSDSTSMSDEPSSPFSTAAMSPMSPRASDFADIDDEDSSIDPASLVNSKKRSREMFDGGVDNALPASKLAKTYEHGAQLAAAAANGVPYPGATSMLISGPALSTITIDVDVNQLLAQQYSWNQLQIQHVMAHLNASQIHQAMALATQPAAQTHHYAAASSTQPAVVASSLAHSAEIVPAATSVKKANGRGSSSSSSSSASASSKKRPKLDPKKDATQCLGHNRKKNKQCGNAALMEFIGPRPMYCAEHIDQDPTSLYTKCASIHHKLNGDGKGCREVVLKEFGVCHKHFDQVMQHWPLSPDGLATARTTLARVSEILELLEMEAAQAKKSDQDLFQRKHKIIPKFVALVRHIEQWIVDTRNSGVTSVASPSSVVDSLDFGVATITTAAVAPHTQLVVPL